MTVRHVLILFNLVALFKRDVTRNERPQLNTLRTRLLVVGAILGTRARRPILRLGLTGHLQARFTLLLERIPTLPGVTVVQFGNWAQRHGFLPPTPWRARDRKSTRLNSSHPQLSRMPSSA